MIKAFVSSTEKNKIGACAYFNFPTTAEKLATEMKKYDIEPEKCRVASIYYADKGLLKTFPPAGLFTLDDLQYIGAKVKDMTLYERDAFIACMELDFADNEKQRLYDAIENVGALSLNDEVQSTADLGRAHVEAGFERVTAVYEKLCNSESLEEKNFAGLFDTLRENFDAAANGQVMLDQNDQYMTSMGLLSVDWQAYFMREDLTVPEEYRLHLDNGQNPSLLARLDASKTAVQHQASAPLGAGPNKQDPTL